MNKEVIDIKPKKLFGVWYSQMCAYALACGYVQRAETDDETKRVSLSREHNVYHVIYVDEARPCETNENLSYYRNWQTFSKLTDARKCFASHLKTIGESQ